MHRDVDYVVVESDFTGRTERYVLAEARLAAYAKELDQDLESRIVRRCKGSELVGLSYTPPFSYFLGHPKSHVVLHAGAAEVLRGRLPEGKTAHIHLSLSDEDPYATAFATIEIV